jgi:nucleoside-diphosphate-sugar epimerase
MKTVFITGASRGIGKEVAKRFARVWGLADKYLPPIGRRALAKWLTDY